MPRMLNELASYYRRQGISPKDFHCHHQPVCSNGKINFVEAKEAFVGTEYEKGTLPRLLFVSLDPGWSDSSPEERTLEYVRRKEEHGCDVDKLPKTQHSYLTHKLALTLLKKIKPDLQLQDTHLYFAHVNSVKCCVGNESHKSAPRIVFRNCQQYIRGELAILDPDILVTQGKMAREAIQSCFKIPESFDDNICAHASITLGNRKVLWFHTPTFDSSRHILTFSMA